MIVCICIYLLFGRRGQRSREKLFTAAFKKITLIYIYLIFVLSYCVNHGHSFFLLFFLQIFFFFCIVKKWEWLLVNRKVIIISDLSHCMEYPPECYCGYSCQLQPLLECSSLTLRKTPRKVMNTICLHQTCWYSIYFVYLGLHWKYKNRILLYCNKQIL